MQGMQTLMLCNHLGYVMCIVFVSGGPVCAGAARTERGPFSQPFAAESSTAMASARRTGRGLRRAQ